MDAIDLIDAHMLPFFSTQASIGRKKKISKKVESRRLTRPKSS